MASSSFIYLVWALALLGCSSFASAAIVEHTFNVQNFTMNRLCTNTVITVVNNSLPGPTINVREGDTVVIHVINNTPYIITIHWHGVFQLMSGWADGPEYVTQCPIRQGESYTYRFNVTNQEGTLWWHAHSQWLRQTVYGPIFIRPRSGSSYPFPKPHKEFPIVLGEWYNGNIIDIEDEFMATGIPPRVSDAFTLNGQPGDLYPCSSKGTTKFTVVSGKTYLLRMINAALNTQMFFKIASHRLTVVALDASYTNPYSTDVVVLAPGQSADVLFTATQTSGRYYMAANAFALGPIAPIGNGTTTGIIEYYGTSRSARPVLPSLPAFNDSATVFTFLSNITGLVTSPFREPVPLEVDRRMFVTVNLGLQSCSGATCPPLNARRVLGSMNNVSFQLPTTLSLLEAFHDNVSGIYTADFPDTPPVVFDYTNPNNSLNTDLVFPERSTRLMKVKFNSTVEIVFQNTALFTRESHPMHLHGVNFFVLARGFGNYNSTIDSRKFNLVNPLERNTVAVPMGGWVAIRFRANNPGVWFIHCHLDLHVPIGLTNAIIIENGPTPATSLPPPPADLPKC